MADPNAPASPDPFGGFDVGPPPQAQAAPPPGPAPAPPPIANDNAPASADEATAGQAQQDPFAKFDVGPAPSSATGAFARGAGKGALPAAGSLAGAGAGAELGGALGTLVEPGLGTMIGGFAGGIGGGVFGAKAVATAQDWAVNKLPDSWKDAIGFGDRDAKADETQHPGASFLGGLAPYAVTMSPSLAFRGAAAQLPENATTLQRILAHPTSAKLFGGGLMGGMEIGNEKLSDQNIQWPKVAIATVFGTVFSKPNGIGEAITEMGAHPTRTVLGTPHPTAAPTLAQAADLKVMGPGITEPVFHGTQEQAPQAALTAQENARQEQAVIGEPQEPDLHAVARQMEPETFAKYDELLKQRETFQNWLSEKEGGPASAGDDFVRFYHGEKGGTEPAGGGARWVTPHFEYARDWNSMGEPNKVHYVDVPKGDLQSRPELAGGYDEVNNYARHFEAPEEIAKQLKPFVGEPTEAMQKHLAATEAEIRDMAPQVAAANRRAADTIGTGSVEAEPFPTLAHMLAAHEAGTGAVSHETNLPEVRPAAEAPAPAEPEAGAVVPAVQPGGPEAVRQDVARTAAAGTDGQLPAPDTLPRPQRTIGEQRAAIAGDVERRLVAAGRPAEEAQAAGKLIAARYITRAGRFEGKLGTPEELYAREGAAIAGPTGRAVAPGDQALTPASRSSDGVATGSDITLPTSGPSAQEPSFQTTERAPPDGVFSRRTMEPSQERGSNNIDMQVPSGRRVYHAINNVDDLEKLARESKPDLDNLLNSAVEGIDGADVYGIRAKERDSFASKLDYQGRQPNQVSDWLGGRIMVDSWGALDHVIARLRQDADVRIVDDMMNEARSGGYRAVHLQIMGHNGLSAEVQIQAREMTTAGEEAHKIYSKWRRREIAPEQLTQAEADQAASEKLYNDAWDAFKQHAGERPPSETHAEPVNAAIEAADQIDDLSPAQQKRVLPAYSPAAETAPRGPDQPAGVFMFDPTALNVDASRFQFKSGGDEYGVTGALRNVTKWDPAKAQSIIVWEANDGKLYVADGHQRAGLARRLTEQGSAKDIQLPGVLYREKDGVSAGDIKAIAAVTNIANGSGSALDGAKVLRARPDLMDGSLPLSVGKGKQAAALARLGDEPFRMVVNDVVPEHYGSIVGELIPNDPARQEAALKAIARFEPKNADEAAVLTQRVAQAELAKAEAGSQTSMFGDLETPESTAGEEMKIVGRAISELKKDKALFSRVLANANRIEQTGSHIAREQAQGVASDAELFAKTLSSDAYTQGPLRTELVKAARDLKNGKSTVGDATGRILNALRREAEAHGADRAGAVERGEEAGERSLELAQRNFEEGQSTYVRKIGDGQYEYGIVTRIKNYRKGSDKFEPLGTKSSVAEAEAARSDLDFESGAEGKPQQLIPGVKPVTQRDLIQAAANKPLTAKKPQKAAGGLFGDSMDQKKLFQAAQGGIKLNPRNAPGRDYLGVSDINPILRLFKQANASTVIHESGHQFLAELIRDAAHPDAPADLKADARTALDWLGVKSAEDIATKHHEKFARGFEQYLREGTAPSPELAGVFAKFRNWLLSIYQSIKGLGTEISPDIRNVFDRLLEMEPQRTIITPHERPPGGPLLHEIHAADAVHTEPHEAEAVADRTLAERSRAVEEIPPEIAREVTPAVEKIEAEQQAAAGGGAQPGGETGAGAGGSGQVVEGGAGPEPLSESGGVGQGRGDLGGSGSQPSAESASVPRVDNRAKLGDNPGTALAPGPGDLFGAKQSPFTDRTGNIRVENLTTREDVAQAIRDSAAENNDFIGDRRGVITDGQVLELADALGMDAAQLSQRQLGQAFNAEQIVAARRLLIQSATDVSAAMKKAATGSDEDVMAYAQAKDRHQLIQAQVAGITAEAGRALRAFRSIAGEESAQATDQFIKQATGKTLFQLRAEAKLGAELQTPQQVSKFMHDSTKHNFSRIVLEYWINGLISGPATHLTYMAGNTLSAIMKVPEAYASAAAGHIASQLGREGTGVHVGEAGALIRGAARGFAPALKAGIDALRTGVTTALPSEGPNQTSLPFQPGSELAQPAHLDEAATFHDAMSAAYGLVQGMKDTVVSTAALVAAGGVPGESLIGREFVPGRATPNITFKGVTVLPTGALATLPGRGVAVIHSFFRSLVFSMEKNAMAYRQAANEGLAGNELHARVAQLRTDPSQGAMDEAAAHEATEAALMGKGSELTQRLSALTNTPIFGSPLLKFIDPFVRVSGNIIDQSLIRRTPAGLLTLFGPETELARDLTGKNGNVAQDKAIGRMMVGTALAVTFGSLAAQKMLSGSGPKDPKEAAIWRMAGNQAHSVRIGDTWYQVNKLGPVGMLASLSADLYDVAHEATQGDLTSAGAHLLHAITQNVLDESAMHGPAELLKAIESPDRYGESYVRNYLAAFVPYSVGLSQIARGVDPYQRDTKTMIDTIRNKIPGHLDSWFGNELPVRRDIWGEALPSRQALGGAGVSAIYEQQINSDPVNQAMYKLGVFPGAVQRKIRNAELTPEQYDDYQRIAGRSAKMRLDKIVISPQFQHRTPSEQHDWMVETIKQSRSMATEMMLHKYPVIAAEATQAKALKKTAINQRNVE